MCVAVIVLWPTPVDRNAAGILTRGLGFLHRHGLSDFVTYGLVEFTANIVMFAPLGLFWFLLAPPRWRWWGPAAGFVLSTGIEAAQYLLLPHRFATPYDVLANTLGAALGTLAAAVLLAAAGSRRRRR